jgi:hypothetical protein
MPSVVDELQSVEAAHKQRLSIQYSWVHAKVALVKIGEDKYTVEGSGNWAENAKHEQYIFLKNEQVFDFRKQWISDNLDS